MLTDMSAEVLDIKNVQISEFLMSQFMLILSQHYSSWVFRPTITLEQRFQASTIWQLTLTIRKQPRTTNIADLGIII